MFAASRVNLSRANRKRALSASPYSDIDSLSTLIRYSPSASLQLINGAAVAAAAAAAAASASASPNSSGSYGHLSTGMYSKQRATSVKHRRRIEKKPCRTTSGCFAVA